MKNLKLKHLKKFNENLDELSPSEKLLNLIKSESSIWEIMSLIREGELFGMVDDGVWDISDIEYISLVPNGDGKDPEHLEELSKFLDKYPNPFVADAYETEYPFLLSAEPTKRVEFIGSGFNYGSNNIIDNCPKRILICGEND
jgi:hypothetical protein